MMDLTSTFGLMFIPFFFTMGIFGFLIAILGTILWLWVLIDCVKRTFKSDTEKLVWVLVLILLGLLGAVIYYFVVKVKDNKNVKGNKKKSKKRRRR